MIGGLQLKSPRIRSVVIFTAGATATALVVLLIYAILTSATKSTEIRDQQQQNSPLIENTAKSLRILRNCTQPGRPCYERAKRDNAAAVGDINRVVVLAAACASGPERLTEKQIQRCVVRRLTEPAPDR